MQFRRVKKPSTALDMGPLLDCVLQLLIFFMLSSTFMSPKVRIDLPEATVTDGATDPAAIVITASEDGRIFINQQEISIGRLEATLGELGAQDKAVVFRGDQKIPFGTFTRIMDAAQRAGVRNFDIAHTALHEEEGGGSGGP